MDTVKLIVAGSRAYTGEQARKHVFALLSFLFGDMEDLEIVSGLAKDSPDQYGLEWAKKNNKKYKGFPADWDKYGKAAGILRNEEMGKYSEALIAFWDGRSRGTNHMIEYMLEDGKKCYIVKVNKNHAQ